MAAIRIGVHPAGGGAVFGYRMGSITDHVDLLTGTTTPAAAVASTLKTQAEAEFPGSTVKLEELVDNGDGTFTWK